MDFILIFLIPVYCGLGLILLKNPIYAIFFFIVIVLHMAVFLIMLNLDFYAFVLVIIYVGAVAVLFIFMVMLLNIKVYERIVRWGNIFIIFSLCIFILVAAFIFERMLIYNILDSYLYMEGVDFNYYYYDSVKLLGIFLFKYYFLVMLGLALFLLVAIVGTVFLILNTVSGYKRLSVFQQIERSFMDLLTFKK